MELRTAAMCRIRTEKTTKLVREINSALLHYFMLVYFGWTAAEAINLYVKLVKALKF